MPAFWIKSYSYERLSFLGAPGGWGVKEVMAQEAGPAPGGPGIIEGRGGSLASRGWRGVWTNRWSRNLAVSILRQSRSSVSGSLQAVTAEGYCWVILQKQEMFVDFLFSRKFYESVCWPTSGLRGKGGLGRSEGSTSASVYTSVKGGGNNMSSMVLRRLREQVTKHRQWLGLGWSLGERPGWREISGGLV